MYAKQSLSLVSLKMERLRGIELVLSPFRIQIDKLFSRTKGLIGISGGSSISILFRSIAFNCSL